MVKPETSSQTYRRMDGIIWQQKCTQSSINFEVSWILLGLSFLATAQEIAMCNDITCPRDKTHFPNITLEILSDLFLGPFIAGLWVISGVRTGALCFRVILVNILFTIYYKIISEVPEMLFGYSL